MVFNVFAHNRDDHTKNHSFLMEEDGGWSVSPAYDVTFASGPGGEHALDVAGEGRSPGVEPIHAVANEVGVGKKAAAAIIDRVKMAVDRWPALARGSGVSKQMTSSIDRVLNGARARKRKPRPS
jgi:serine/threonine-protein kinase HipA